MEYVSWPSEGVVLVDSDGTAPMDGVKSVLREPKSELAVDVPGRSLGSSFEGSFFPLINPPSFPRKLELMPSRCVLKSLFSIADATMIGRGFRMWEGMWARG